MDAKRHQTEYPEKCPKTKGKITDIPEGNLVLLWDHPEDATKYNINIMKLNFHGSEACRAKCL